MAGQISKLLISLLILAFVMTSCLLAKNQAVAFLKLLKILELFFLGYYISKNNYTLKASRYALIFPVVYSSLLALGQFLKQASLGGVFWWFGERSFTAATPGIARLEFNGQLFLRPYATFSHPNSLAGFLLVGLILTLPFLWQKFRRLAISYLLLTVSAIVLTVSRPVWLAGILVLVLGAVQSIKPRNFLPSFLLLMPESLTRRSELNKIAIQLIEARPVFGVGMDNFLLR
ncbi:MAG: hypothetical protein ABH807_02040, partial [Candidatus Shapirobacteria bacterium]